MLLRRILAVAFGTAVLVLATSTVAEAAGGAFTYRYTGTDGTPQLGMLVDPASRDCVTLPEVADVSTTLPADSPRNYTDATATVFTEPDCEGDYFTLRPLTGHGSERLKLRSVVFS